MRWYVQLSALLHTMVAESVIDALELDLERKGVLCGSEPVQGNPGPSLDFSMVVEAATPTDATTAASALAADALRRGGVESSIRFGSHVMPMSEVERLTAKARAGTWPPAGGNWLSLRVVDDEDAPPHA